MWRQDNRKKSPISSHFEISFSQIVNLARKKRLPPARFCSPAAAFLSFVFRALQRLLLLRGWVCLCRLQGFVFCTLHDVRRELCLSVHLSCHPCFCDKNGNDPKRFRGGDGRFPQLQKKKWERRAQGMSTAALCDYKCVRLRFFFFFFFSSVIGWFLEKRGISNVGIHFLLIGDGRWRIGGKRRM